jgi:type II secretory pathway predicted ATPase ExeA
MSMTPPELAQALPDVSTDDQLNAPFMTECQRNALERLALAFRARLPLVTLIAEGKSATDFVIGRFLAEQQAADVALARITRACADANSGMREIIRAIGFQPKDMTLPDLEKIFTMFLSYQRTHNQRTIVCIDDAQDCGSWMLDKIRRLVELETAGQYGLMVILSGQPSLHRLLGESPLHAIRGQTRERIYLAPLTEAESREYVQRRVQANAARDITEVFDYHALGLMHELSAGVPDVLRDLCTKCFELLDDEKIQLVTPDVVQQAGEQLRPPIVPVSEAVESIPTERVDSRLMARINGELLQEQTLNRGHVLIGRDVMCDICVNHPTVSRYHALVVNSPRGVKVVDLGSTNGTFVNERKFRQYPLKDGDILSVGSCDILFIAGDDQRALTFDTDRTDSFESQKSCSNSGPDLDVQASHIKMNGAASHSIPLTRKNTNPATPMRRSNA